MKEPFNEAHRKIALSQNNPTNEDTNDISLADKANAGGLTQIILF